MISILANRMLRIGSSEWSSLIAAFIEANKLCPECLENIYDSGCIGVKNTRAEKILEIMNKYNSFDLDEDEFQAFVLKAECKNVCSDELEKCLVKKYYGLTDEEWEDYKNIQNCLGEFYGLLPQLKITNPKEQIKLCKSNELGSIRECKDCNVDQKSIVNLDHDRAREMLRCAANKLYNYDGNLPDEVKTALEKHFSGISKEIFADFLSFMCKYVRFNSADCNYINQLKGQGNCGPLTNAWTFPFFDVRVCDPNYWNEVDPYERSRILIHEWFHK